MKTRLVDQILKAAEFYGRRAPIEFIRNSRKVTYVRLTDIAYILGLENFPMLLFRLVPYAHTNAVGDYEILRGHYAKIAQKGSCIYQDFRYAPSYESCTQKREALGVWVRASWAVKVLKVTNEPQMAEHMAIMTTEKLGYAVVPARFGEVVHEICDMFHYFDPNIVTVSVSGEEFVVMHRPFNFSEWQIRIHPSATPLVSLPTDQGRYYCVFPRLVA